MSFLNSEHLTTLVMAGGYGTRLREVTGDLIPKPLVRVNNKTLLEYSIEPFVKDSQRIILFLSFMAQSIINYLGENNIYEYEVQDKSPGIIGAIQDTVKAKNVRGDIAIVEGDSIRDNLSVSSLYRFHREKEANTTIAATRKVPTNPDHYHGVAVDNKTGEILRIHEPNDGTDNPYPMIALAMLSPLAVQAFLEIQDKDKSWATFLPVLQELGSFYAHIQDVVYFNVNTPDLYEEAQKHFLEKS